jgi:glycogen synthase
MKMYLKSDFSSPYLSPGDYNRKCYTILKNILYKYFLMNKKIEKISVCLNFYRIISESDFLNYNITRNASTLLCEWKENGIKIHMNNTYKYYSDSPYEFQLIVNGIDTIYINVEKKHIRAEKLNKILSKI